MVCKRHEHSRWRVSCITNHNNNTSRTEGAESTKGNCARGFTHADGSDLVHAKSEDWLVLAANHEQWSMDPDPTAILRDVEYVVRHCKFSQRLRVKLRDESALVSLPD